MRKFFQLLPECRIACQRTDELPKYQMRLLSLVGIVFQQEC